MKAKLLVIAVGLIPMLAYAGSDQMCYKDNNGGYHCVYGNGSRIDASAERGWGSQRERDVEFTDAFGKKTRIKCSRWVFGQIEGDEKCE